MRNWIAALPLAALAACGAPDAPADNAAVSLRNLGDSDVAAPPPARYTVKGDLIPTPSDARSRYYLLRARATAGGTVVAIVRQEHDGRVAYARAEADCGRRLFHVLGVAPNRALAETEIAHDGPLRPIAGLPLREELARFACAAAGTPLAAG